MEMETFQNSFYEVNIALIQKLDNGTTRRENYRLTYLMNTDAKFFNRIPKKQIQH